MRRMRFSLCERVAGLVSLTVLCSLTSYTSHAAAGDGTFIPWLRTAGQESSLKLIQIRKLLHWGGSGDGDSSISLGPAFAQLFWQKKWKWPEPGREQKLPGGLLGGPMLSISVPWKALGRLFSIETRLSSYRYVAARADAWRTNLQELGDPQDQFQSVEAGLHFTMSLAGLF